ncbi:MAG: hypothetical protein K2M98_02190, partial [Muribaculum sp.]|nr:hypothetical protein [Muribaculum sp.]
MKITTVTLCTLTTLGFTIPIPHNSMASTVLTEEQYAAFPTYSGEDLEVVVTDCDTRFALWSPEADSVKVI